MAEIIKAKQYFYNKEYIKAEEIFIQHNFLYEAGLCCFLLNDFIKARKYWTNCNNNLFATKWGLIILDILENKKPPIEPSFFQIRAFYEIYLSLLIENQMFNIAEKLVQEYQYFSLYNLEVPKFISRVLHAYNYNDGALKFIEISLQENYVDVEALFVGIQIYIEQGNINKASEYLKLLLENAPTYYPALKIKEKNKI